MTWDTDDDQVRMRRMFSEGDTFDLSDNDDVVYAYGRADLICGRAGWDMLSGGGSADDSYGSCGNDDLKGGSGKDWLTGGSGYEDFVSGAVGESAASRENRDVITKPARG